ncbi:MAG: hypothetical protein MMC33_002147 [Icmadophila ericetorum]|nr:hypothetical protein [Icmadophila ericetorum]
MLLHRARSKDAKLGTGYARTSVMSPEQVGQQTVTTTPSSFRPSPLKFFLSSAPSDPPKPESSQKKWTAEYLTDLRSNRPTRPNGSRPLPVRRDGNKSTTTFAPVIGTPLKSLFSTSRPTVTVKETGIRNEEIVEEPSSPSPQRRPQSVMSMSSPIRGRPLAQESKQGEEMEEDLKATGQNVINPSYLERGERWMEKQEARSLRVALEDMDLKAEKRLHAAAQDEASELVWKHRNPGAPFRNPDTPYDYKAHLRKGSYTRSHSTDRYPMLGMGVVGSDKHRSTSDSSTSNKSDGGKSKGSRVSSASSRQSKAESSKSQSTEKNEKQEGENKEEGQDKTSTDLNFPVPPKVLFKRRRSIGSKSRQVSGENTRSPFKNPEDQIYEEPEEVTESAPNVQKSVVKPTLPNMNRNPISRLQGARDFPNRSTSVPARTRVKFPRFDIHANPPSQSRNPEYLRNVLPPTPPDSASASDSDTKAEGPLTKNGLEIRSDEIRAATSMRLKDRSPKLPTPTVVSDRPGRPIVSFDPDYKPKEIALKHEHSPSSLPITQEQSARSLLSKPTLPTSTVSAPTIPTISLPDPPEIHISDSSANPDIQINSVPEISVSVPEIFTIAVSDPASRARPLPSPADRYRAPTHHRPNPRHSSTLPIASKPLWSSFSHRATAQCAACALPIEGRVVSAASKRFHPACFNCYQCGELLECVAFYPEPDNFRFARLARINARLNGEPIPANEANYTEEYDGDDSLRFFCHLDFHELFSPRCRSCKTPIEGEVIIACGGEWHVGHFFCAECGDPFNQNTPFVEKDGYAWCVDCHCKRFSGKCAGCRRPIVNMVVTALGKEWHQDCFCCTTCGGKFEDGRFFTRGDDEYPVCVRCEEIRLKA